MYYAYCRKNVVIVYTHPLMFELLSSILDDATNTSYLSVRNQPKFDEFHPSSHPRNCRWHEATSKFVRNFDVLCPNLSGRIDRNDRVL